MIFEIVSRSEARNSGSTRYFSGVPCPHGHICQRHVSNRGCVECQAVAQASRSRNKERLREYDRQRYLKNREANRERALKNFYNNLRRIRDDQYRYYHNGPKRLTGELRWLKKNQAMLRNLKRALRSSNPHEALLLLSKEFPQVSNSQH